MYVYYTRCSLSSVDCAIVIKMSRWFCICCINSTEYAQSIGKMTKIKALVLTNRVSVDFLKVRI